MAIIARKPGAKGSPSSPPRAPTSDTPRARLAVAQRRAQLVELGLTLFGAHSYDTLSIDEIARAAGISKGLLYHYFPSKRDFYVATVRAAAHELIAETEAAADSHPDDKLRAGLDAYIDYVSRHAESFVSLMRSGVGADREVTQIVEGVRVRILERMLEQLGAPVEPLLRTALRGYIGFVEAAVLEWLARGDLQRDALRELLLQTALATVGYVAAVPKAGA